MKIIRRTPTVSEVIAHRPGAALSLFNPTQRTTTVRLTWEGTTSTTRLECDTGEAHDTAAALALMATAWNAPAGCMYSVDQNTAHAAAWLRSIADTIEAGGRKTVSGFLLGS
jgi:hypothetical protein